MLQNATLLRKSAPGPPNSSDEHVSCAAPATEHASVQFCPVLTRCAIPCARHAKRHPKVVRTPGVFSILTSKCALRYNGVHFFDISTSKSGPDLVSFVHSDFEMCFAPQRRALFRHLNFQKCPMLRCF